MKNENNKAQDIYIYIYMIRKLKLSIKKIQPQSANKTLLMVGGTSSIHTNKLLTCLRCLVRF